ncbi:MAG: amidohydrolase [Symbiobacteriia bacterium]
MTADLVILNARVATMDPAAPAAAAVAAENGRILAAGDDAAIRPHIGPRTRVLDARGRRLIPGFIDSHMHLLGYGLFLERIELGDAASLDEVAARVRERAGLTQAGAWILGGGWDEGRLGGLPSRDWLDKAASAHPVFLSRHCYHIGVANTAALKAAGLWDRSTAIAGGIIDRDASGWPTGILREHAKDRIDQAMPPLTAADYRRALRRAAAAAARQGLTSVHSNDGKDYPLAELLAAYEELTGGPAPLPLRVWWDFALENLEAVAERGWRSGMGTDRFRIGAVKTFADGSLGGRTAALQDPYSDDPGNRGVLLWDEAALAERMAFARSHGFQMAVHVIGDLAQDVALRAYERAHDLTPLAAGAHAAASRLRLIHCQISNPALWRRMRGLGVVADVQPRFVSSDYPIIEARVGAARAATSYAWRGMAQAGVPLAFSSDCPVEPVAPMQAIYAAVTRQTMDGEPVGGWLPAEQFSVADAIACHTRGGAYAVGEEQEKGCIRPGYLADLALLEQDPWGVSPSELKDVQVAATIVGGQVIFEA